MAGDGSLFSTPSFGSSSTPSFGPSSSPSPPPNNQTSLFGGFASASSPFGSQAAMSAFGSPAFGQSGFGGQREGSRATSYSPTVEVDGGSSTQAAGKLDSISAMPAYKDKSHEELRWKDYEAGDKAPSSFLFGSSPSHPPASFTTPAFTPEHSSMPTSSSPFMVFGAASSVANVSSSTLSTDSLATEKHASEAKSEVPSLEQDKVMDKSKSMVKEFQTKTGEYSGESADPIIKIILNSGLNISLAKLPEEVETEETACKSEKFSNTRILRGITHNPHFTPLWSYSKRSRVILIAGWDEICQETIDQIQGLTTETFRINAHELWKTVAELENLGYNVARLRKRLDELTDVVKKRDSSEAEISHLKAKADEYRKEKKKIESDIAGLEARADKAQVMVDELVDQADKMESNLPVVDALFVNLAKNPL